MRRGESVSLRERSSAGERRERFLEEGGSKKLNVKEEEKKSLARERKSVLGGDWVGCKKANTEGRRQ